MKPLTIVYVTSRKEPKLEWFYQSLIRQLDGREMTVWVIDSNLDCDFAWYAVDAGVDFLPHGYYLTVQKSRPKPTIWQGEHRITSTDWWAKSNALNTGICRCKTEWIAFVDDRSILMPQWLWCIEQAMIGNYAVCGRYEKRANVKVVDGVISAPGELLRADHRADLDYAQPTEHWFGGHCALPLEWCLAVNGYPEVCDSLGS